MPDLAPHHRTPLGRATIGDQLRRHARTQPHKPAVIAYDLAGSRTETTYAALDERANRFAQLFRSRGIGRGGRIASMARNGADVVAAHYGALKIGAAFTGVNPLYREAEVAYQLQTGPGDTWLFVMPFHTIAGLGSMTSLTLMGATLVLPATAEPATALRIIGREGVTVIAQTPTFYIALSAQDAFGPETVGRVRRCMTYGGQIPPHVIDAWATATPDVLWGTYWGQSELSQLGTVGFFRTLADVPGGDPTWIGKPVSHLEIRVVDAEDRDAEIGELICRTPSAMLGYLDDPERTAAVFRDGWVRTGDMVRIDADGNLFFHDRLKDMIKSGGMNVSSQEVERVVHAHPAVERAAVVGMPDPYWSEAVTAFVVLRAGRSVTEAELVAHCRAELASYKVPKAVHVVEELPVDPQGKILKRRLRTAAAH